MLLFYGGLALSQQMALSVAGLKQGKIWQLLTFQFLHAVPWPWHVLFNCLGLYFFGRPIEEMLGGRKFLTLYFSAGVAGGLLHVLATTVLPRHFDIQVVGASAGVCGLVATFCALNPKQELTTFIYFFPVNLQARFLLMFIGLLSLFGTLIPFDRVAHGAHLGGLLLGMGFVRWREGGLNRFLPRLQFKVKRQPAPEPVRAGGRQARAWKAEPTAPAETAPDLFISKEVDPILDKISEHGIQSLTDAERKILESARKRMGQK
jgi:membrane associated rhomboid family serine protease